MRRICALLLCALSLACVMDDSISTEPIGTTEDPLLPEESTGGTEGPEGLDDTGTDGAAEGAILLLGDPGFGCYDELVATYEVVAERVCSVFVNPDIECDPDAVAVLPPVRVPLGDDCDALMPEVVITEPGLWRVWVVQYRTQPTTVEWRSCYATDPYYAMWVSQEMIDQGVVLDVGDAYSLSSTVCSCWYCME